MDGAHRFTALMVSTEISALRRLHGMLEHDGVQTREEFRDMMAAAFSKGGLDARYLSDDMGFNHSTVFRWKEGQSAPHPSLWPRVTAWVLDALDARIVRLEEELSDTLGPDSGGIRPPEAQI